MVADFSGLVLDLVGRWGLGAIFVLLVLDAAMLLPVVPGEIFIVLATTRYVHDWSTFALVAVLLSVAGTLGSLAVYGISRYAGQRWRAGRPPTRLERVFQRPAGQTLVIWLRLFPLTRLLVNVPAGLVRMPVGLFLLYTFIGNLLFHAGLMYLAYDPRVAARVDALHDAYAEPTMAFLRTHWVAVGLVLLALGILLSMRATARTSRRPHDGPKGSLLGTLAAATLFWGGASVLGALWLEPALVFDAASIIGFDLEAATIGLPYAPLGPVAALAAAAALLGLALTGAAHSARSRARASRRAARAAALAARRPPEPPAS